MHSEQFQQRSMLIVYPLVRLLTDNLVQYYFGRCHRGDNFKISTVKKNLKSQHFSEKTSQYKETNLTNQEIFLKELLTENFECKQNFQTQETVIILGKTGVGKSTILNILFEKNVSAAEISGKNVILINEQQLSLVNHGGNSCTAKPIIARDKYGIYWIDCPGFFDTQGPEQEIKNALYIDNLFKKIQNFQILLMIEDSATHGRINQIKDLLNNLKTIFGSNISKCFRSCVLVVTKGKKDKSNRLLKRLSSQIQGIQNYEMKYLFQDLIQNRLYSFPQHEQNEKIHSREISDQIRKYIKKAKYFMKPQVNFNLSPKAKYYIDQSLIKLKQKFLKNFREIGLCLTKSQNSIGQLTLRQLKRRREDFNTLLRLQHIITIDQIFNYLTSFKQICKNRQIIQCEQCLKILNGELENSCKLKQFISLSVKSQMKVMEVNLDQIVQTFIRSISKKYSQQINERQRIIEEERIKREGLKEVQRLRREIKRQAEQKERQAQEHAERCRKKQMQHRKVQQKSTFSKVISFFTFGWF